MKLPNLPDIRSNQDRGVVIASHPGGEIVLDDRKRSPRRQIPNATEVNLERDCRTCRRNRRGAAAVEFAFVAPVFILLVFGMIEFGRAIMVQQVMTNAAREGARVAVLDSTTPTHDTVVSKVTTYLQNSGISGATVTLNPTEPTASTVKNGDPITVTITIPYTSVSWMPSPWFLKTTTLTARSVMRRESVQ
jgi:Flp pilus assembly protein TadG